MTRVGDVKRIAVMMHLDRPFKRHVSVYSGILEFARKHSDWKVVVDEWADHSLPARRGAASPYDCIIGRVSQLGAERVSRAARDAGSVTIKGLHLALFILREELAGANEVKHGIRFEEAKTIFNDPFSVTIHDPEHSDDEERWIDIGLSSEGRLLVVWYTQRGEQVRVIGCREATRTEERAYSRERS